MPELDFLTLVLSLSMAEFGLVLLSWHSSGSQNLQLSSSITVIGECNRSKLHFIDECRLVFCLPRSVYQRWLTPQYSYGVLNKNEIGVLLCNVARQYAGISFNTSSQSDNLHDWRWK
jgi:hypothetical protein